MNLPRIHPREEIVTKAEMDLHGAVLDVLKRYDLTTAESIRVLTEAFSAQLHSIAKFCIRQERHGDADKPGGFE